MCNGDIHRYDDLSQLAFVVFVERLQRLAGWAGVNAA
jgi:hypothetical protein